jgi:hypothetical protein
MTPLLHCPERRALRLRLPSVLQISCQSYPELKSYDKSEPLQSLPRSATPLVETVIRIRFRPVAALLCNHIFLNDLPLASRRNRPFVQTDRSFRRRYSSLGSIGVRPDLSALGDVFVWRKIVAVPAWPRQNVSAHPPSEQEPTHPVLLDARRPQRRVGDDPAFDQELAAAPAAGPQPPLV